MRARSCASRNAENPCRALSPGERPDGGVGREIDHGDLALGHEHLNRPGAEQDIERRANGADRDARRLDHEGSARIGGDGEVGLPAEQRNPAFVGGENDPNLGARVQLDYGAVAQNHPLVAAGRGRVGVGCRRGRPPGPESDGRDDDRGGHGGHGTPPAA